MEVDIVETTLLVDYKNLKLSSLPNIENNENYKDNGELLYKFFQLLLKVASNIETDLNDNEQIISELITEVFCPNFIDNEDVDDFKSFININFETKSTLTEVMSKCLLTTKTWIHEINCCMNLYDVTKNVSLLFRCWNILDGQITKLFSNINNFTNDDKIMIEYVSTLIILLKVGYTKVCILTASLLLLSIMNMFGHKLNDSNVRIIRRIEDVNIRRQDIYSMNSLRKHLNEIIFQQQNEKLSKNSVLIQKVNVGNIILDYVITTIQDISEQRYILENGIVESNKLSENDTELLHHVLDTLYCSDYYQYLERLGEKYNKSMDYIIQVMFNKLMLILKKRKEDFQDLLKISLNNLNK